MCVFYPVLRTPPEFQNPYQRIQSITQFESLMEPVREAEKGKKGSEVGKEREKKKGKEEEKREGGWEGRRKEGREKTHTSQVQHFCDHFSLIAAILYIANHLA